MARNRCLRWQEVRPRGEIRHRNQRGNARSIDQRAFLLREIWRLTYGDDSIESLFMASLFAGEHLRGSAITRREMLLPRIASQLAREDASA